jgi:predicted Zn finger-like uncharacterized protein
MFTVCPKCALTLVVTAADLRVAQGYVRCGRCSSVFNAIARLSEEQRGAAAAAAGAPAVPAAPETMPPPARAPTEESLEDAAPAAAEESAAESAPEENESALEFNPETTDVNSVFVQAAPDPEWTAATGSFKARVAASESPPAPPPEALEVEIYAEDFAAMLHLEPAESPLPASAPVPPQEREASAAPPAPNPAPQRPEPEASATAAPRRPASTAPGAPRGARAAAHQATHTRPDAQASARRSPVAPAPAREMHPAPEQPAAALEADSEEDPTERAALASPAAQPWLRAHAWMLAAILAALVLLAQILNHNRDELAANARFNHPLTRLYGALGIKLFPRWDLRAYDVRQLGAEADSGGAGVITVRASIKNAAPEPQPLPLLRVTLQDRFGNRIAMRDVTPHSYLPESIPPASFLAAGQRIDAQMGFADPGADAVGFEIDACLPARGGVACANDAALR